MFVFLSAAVMVLSSCSSPGAAATPGVPAVTQTELDPRLSPQQAALLAASTSLGSMEVPRDVVVSDGSAFVVTYGRVTEYPASGAEPTSFDLPPGRYERAPVRRDGALWLPGPDEAVVVLRDGAWVDAGFRASVLADAPGEGLVLTRSREVAGSVAGGDARVAPAQALVVRADSGAERTLQVFPNGVAGLAVGHGQALVAAAARPSTWAGVHLRTVPLDGSAGAELGFWPWLGSLVPATDGWLVTGRPEDGPPGVYRIDRAGARSLVLSGDHAAAVPVAGGDLLVFSQWTLGRMGGPHRVMRVPAATLVDLGPRFDPIIPVDLQAVGEAALAELRPRVAPTAVLADRAIGKTFLAAADRAMNRRLGVSLPNGRLALFELLERAKFDPAVGTEAYLLLVVMVTEDMLAQGATWTPGRTPKTLVGFGRHRGMENEFSVATMPEELVRGMVFDSEGFDWLLLLGRDEVGARAWFVGHDPVALRARLDAAASPGPR